MKTLHKLESGDTIFIITDKYQIKEITLKYEHLLENRKNRWMIDRPYQLKSDIVKHGRVRLTKVSFHEEMDWDGCHYLKRWRDYDDTDMYAYLSREDAEAFLESQISKEERFESLHIKVKEDLSDYLQDVKNTLSNYIENIKTSDLENVATKSKEHQNLLNLYDAIQSTKL